MDPHFLVVIGASLGGVRALLRLLPQLPADFPAPVLVVLHIGAYSSRMPALLENRGALPVVQARDGDVPQVGRIYFAAPDHHMVVEAGTIRLPRGPKEHHSRPAIDPLFRSAALEYGERTVGVVLTGALDDGTAGLQAIKDCGGFAIVQDPRDAEEPSMPMSALAHVDVDRCVPLEAMAATLTALVTLPVRAGEERTSGGWVHENAIAVGAGEVMDHLQAIARPSTFVCPDCKGALWEVDGTVPLRYRCHTGHGFSLRSLQQTQSEQTEEALWTAIRALQEKELLARKLAEVQAGSGDADGARASAVLADETAERCRQLRAMVEEV
jgi:two-component system chemotaxis response regulator CheB